MPSGFSADANRHRAYYSTAAFRVRFIGRERSGRAGHLGLWEKAIWPEQMMEMEPLPAPDCRSYWE